VDSGRFDDLTRAIGRGVSRRTMLKGLLGLGGAGAVARTLGPDPAVDAARRPTPTPKPVTCPGNQYWDGSACVCPGELDTCGPACCEPGVSECCDNACCHGECYGEELCCARVGEIQPLVCTSQTGTACCDVSENACCTVDGCCAGTCYGGSDGVSFCCSGIVCESESGPICYPEGECCVDADCPSLPGTCAVGVCNGGVCEQIPNECEDGEVCCGGACCPESNCCSDPEGIFQFCYDSERDECCSYWDCLQGPQPPPCHFVECLYDSVDGHSYCGFVNDCGEDQLCCFGACETVEQCPDCETDEDCTDVPMCLNDTTLQVPVCVDGLCSFELESCVSEDPCWIGSCDGDHCTYTAADACMPECCGEGDWICNGEGACECQDLHVCDGVVCAECCDDSDCYSDPGGTPGCIFCVEGACIPAIEDTPCVYEEADGFCFQGSCQPIA
jgi:hypothetical protein